VFADTGPDSSKGERDVTTRLTDDAIRLAMDRVPGWELQGDAIRRQFTFDGFPGAIAFIVRLGFAAEAADHHPDILVSYKRVTLTYSTHSAGGLTEKDFAGAAEADRLAGRALTG
jgi:4a-hydroxytetrahydrobiopterin dehydratase